MRLIDDVTLARAIKTVGPIYLGHSGLATSIRPYPHFSDIWNMVSRTAFTQLRYSLTLLLLTLLGLTLVWLVPVGALLFGSGWIRACGAATVPARRRQLCTDLGALPQQSAVGAGPAADRAVLHGGHRRVGVQALVWNAAASGKTAPTAPSGQTRGNKSRGAEVFS